MKRIRTRHPKSRLLSSKIEHNFDLFWRAYPRKVGKKACKKVWFRVYSSIPPIDALIRIVEHQSEYYEWDKPEKRKYIPHPSTWLNQGRWDDELDYEPEGRTISKKAKVNIGAQRKW